MASVSETTSAEPIAEANVDSAADIHPPVKVPPTIVLVAFGTAMEEARKVYDEIDATVRQRYPGHEVRWAYTSRHVLRKLAKQGIELMGLPETVADLVGNGHDHVIFQSLHIVPGQEHCIIDDLDTGHLTVTVGDAMLTTDDDIAAIIDAIEEDIEPDVPNVIITHGNGKYDHFNERILAFALKLEAKHRNVVVCSIKGNPGTDRLAEVRRQAEKAGKVHFIPLMLVSGIHVMDDVLGGQDDSWKNIIGAEEVTCAKPLGYNDTAIDLLLQHLDATVAEAAAKPSREKSRIRPAYVRALPGHFYAVGIGPGAPDLVTLRAARLIESADVIIAPRSRMAKESVALTTVKDLIADQEVIDHVYTMQRDVDLMMSRWTEMATLVAERCGQRKSVVQITLGDPMIYSTSCYLVETARERMPGEKIHVVPGITAFQTVASHFGEALSVQEDRMTLMPATDIEKVEEALDGCETLVLYKVAKHLEPLADLLERRGLLDCARLICYAEHDGKEFATTDLREAAGGKHGYLATVIVHVGRRGWDAPNGPKENAER